MKQLELFPEFSPTFIIRKVYAASIGRYVYVINKDGEFFTSFYTLKKAIAFLINDVGAIGYEIQKTANKKRKTS